MSKLGVVEDTLFVPMLGRIYASEHCPNVLYDQKALELKNKLPTDLLGKGGQSQYTLLSGAQFGWRDRSTRLRPGDSLLSQ